MPQHFLQIEDNILIPTLVEFITLLMWSFQSKLQSQITPRYLKDLLLAILWFFSLMQWDPEGISSALKPKKV